VKDEKIKNRWRAYFDKLFNDESEKTAIELDDSIDINRRFVRRIQESEVKEALKKMKIGKALGPDDIPIEVWRCLRDIAIVWLTKLFNTIFRSNKMPDEWRRSILVPICATLFRALRTASGRWDAEEGHEDPSQACICLMSVDSTV
jgi:hypothetical protein